MPLGSKYCSSCGTSLVSLSETPPNPHHSPRETFTPFSPKQDNDGDEDIDRIDHLDIRQNRLEIEIVRNYQQGEKLGNTVLAGMGGGPPEPIEPRPGQYAQDIDKKTFAQEFQKEAGAMRPQEKSHSVKPDE